MSFAGRTMAFKWDLPTGLLSVIAAALALLPLLGFLLAWHMWADLAGFTRLVTIPGLLALSACEVYLLRRSPLLFNRFASGLIGGVVATLAFDIVTVIGGVLFGGVPDFAALIGQQLSGETVGIQASAHALALGYAYEYLLIGAMLGSAYSLVMGRGRWHWAAASAAVAGFAFVALPQFWLYTVAEGYVPAIAVSVYVLAFAVAGATLGLVVQRLGRTNANAFYVVFLREERVEAPELVGGWRG